MLTDQNDMSATMPAEQDYIFDVGTVDFEDKVMRASMDGPVLVDFWAPWCGPCKQLMPLLEKIISEYKGQIKLAKVNIDEQQELAMALRVQSVPMVFSFIGGQPVNAFAGAKTESEIRAFIDELLKASGQAPEDQIDVTQALKEAAQALANNDLHIAQGLYVQIMTQDENNVDAYTGLIRTFIAGGQLEHAQEMINEATDVIKKDPQFEAAKSALDLAQNVPVVDYSELENKLSANPKDHAVRFELAMALFSAGEKERAIDELVEIIRVDKKWEDEKARVQLLQFFDALGPVDPLTIAGRRKLSSVLFS